MRRETVRAYGRHPELLLFYFLVYWGRTISLVSIAVSLVLYLTGIARPVGITLAVVATVVTAFGLGVTVGTFGVPPGKRR